ncbi:MAG: MotA/TolQ/ExbB proton channel family protein, partial [Gammaproteobacteria bacterium]|nr:MotA/TolQ/ExbB proton channel family protein [Gammaproteobacteria bacterium]
MHVDTSILSLIIEANVLVQLVMLLLLAASVVSWTMIVSKWKTIKEARRQADAFEEQFWSGANLATLYEQVKNHSDPTGMENIFVSGFSEYIRLYRKQKVTTIAITDTALRSMKVAMSREVESLEHYLSFLATVGSTAPYVGLFGTVWGIMNAFRALSDVQQATLSAVAPG